MLTTLILSLECCTPTLINCYLLMLPCYFTLFTEVAFSRPLYTEI